MSFVPSINSTVVISQHLYDANANCAGNPLFLSFYPPPSESTCKSLNATNGTCVEGRMNIECSKTSEIESNLKTVLGEQFILASIYKDAECKELVGIYGIVADGKCRPFPNALKGFPTVKTTLSKGILTSNGYGTPDCSGPAKEQQENGVPGNCVPSTTKEGILFVKVSGPGLSVDEQAPSPPLNPTENYPGTTNPPSATSTSKSWAITLGPTTFSSIMFLAICNLVL